MQFAEIVAQLDEFLAKGSGPRQARKRVAILRAATDLFVAYGYRKTSIEDVAGAAGVAKGTVYLYYANKAELMLHAAALQKRQYLAELIPAFDPTLAPADRLREMIRLGIVLTHRLPLLQRLTGREHELERVFDEADETMLREITTQQVRAVSTLIDDATADALPREVVEERAAVLIDLMLAVVNSGNLIGEHMALEEYARVTADVMVNGVVSTRSAPGGPNG